MNFIYDGKSSKDFNLVITKVKRHDTPERNIETINVPGRDGDLYIDNGSYGARKIEVEGYIKNDVATYSRLIDAWLYRKFKIEKLFFSDEADIYYEGMCINKISFSETFKHFNECKIIFECKPYKKLFDGDNIVNINVNNSKLFNPTDFESDPIVKIYGTGNIDLSINNKVIHLTNIQGFIVIDSELMDCYKEAQLLNNKMNGEFPKLDVGINTISWVGTVTKVEITPKWRWL